LAHRIAYIVSLQVAGSSPTLGTSNGCTSFKHWPRKYLQRFDYYISPCQPFRWWASQFMVGLCPCQLLRRKTDCELGRLWLLELYSV